jgi:calcineurin-like phosphoesterase family protein
MVNYWFISDTHFGHTNIIKYDQRPFPDIQTHDRTLIANWQAVVQPDDEVYHLGDFAFASQARVKQIINQLPGKIYHIQGNHDKVILKNADVRACFIWSKPLFDLKLQWKGQRLQITLCHYSMRVFNKSHHGALQFYGHSHFGLPGNTQQLNVGVMHWGYTPVRLEQALSKLPTLTKYSP